jgi:hypothetical protein
MIQPLELSVKIMKRHRDLVQSQRFRAARPSVDIRCEVKCLAASIQACQGPTIVCRQHELSGRCDDDV